MIIYIAGTPICPSCGSLHPNRIADSCGYCENCPEIRGEMLQLPEWAESLLLPSILNLPVLYQGYPDDEYMRDVTAGEYWAEEEDDGIFYYE